MEKQLTLTPFESLSLMNQLSILKHLDPENAEHYEDHIEILHGGCTIMYGELFKTVIEEILRRYSGRLDVAGQSLTRRRLSYVRLNPVKVGYPA